MSMSLVRKKTVKTEDSWLIAYADMITNLLIFFVALLSAASLSQVKMQQIASSLSGMEQSSDLKSIEKELNDQIKELKLEGSVMTELTDDGLRLHFNSGVVFDSADDKIPDKWLSHLKKIVQTILPYNKKYKIAVEGHTDSRPIHSSRFSSNWELSSARAHRVRDFLEEVGFDPSSLHGESYSDTIPLKEELIRHLPEEDREALRRRVVIRIY